MVPAFDVVHDGLDQSRYVLEYAALETLLIEVAEKTLDDVQP